MVVGFAAFLVCALGAYTLAWSLPPENRPKHKHPAVRGVNSPSGAPVGASGVSAVDEEGSTDESTFQLDLAPAGRMLGTIGIIALTTVIEWLIAVGLSSAGSPWEVGIFIVFYLPAHALGRCLTYGALVAAAEQGTTRPLALVVILGFATAGTALWGFRSFVDVTLAIGAFTLGGFAVASRATRRP